MRIRSGWLRASIYWVLLLWDCFAVTKQLSQIQRSTLWPLQDANLTPSIGGFGLKPTGEVSKQSTLDKLKTWTSDTGTRMSCKLWVANLRLKGQLSLSQESKIVSLLSTVGLDVWTNILETSVLGGTLGGSSTFSRFGTRCPALDTSAYGRCRSGQWPRFWTAWHRRSLVTLAISRKAINARLMDRGRTMDIKKAMLSLMGGLWVSAAICAASGGLYSLWIWGIAHYYEAKSLCGS